MNRVTFSLVLIVVAVSILIILIICLRYKRIVSEKNRSIVRQIHEQESLKRKLERTCFEKEVLEKCLNMQADKNDKTIK